MLNRPNTYSYARQEYYRENDNVYFNATITHPDAVNNINPGIPSSGTQPIVARYEVNNDTPFIDNASEYYCSVIRFDIPLNAVPLFVCPIIPNTNNIALSNTTPLIIGVTFGGVNFPVYLIYTPGGGTVPVTNPAPIQNLPEQIITPYYYIYSYNLFIEMINIALETAWTNAGQALIDTPYFFLDASAGLINLVVSPAAYTTNEIIFMNTQLANYLGEGFTVVFHGNNQPDGRDYTFDLELSASGTLRANNQYPIAGVGWGIFSEEYQTLALWSTIRKILITSARLPIVAESVAVGDSNSSRQAILTDFVPQVNNVGDSRQIAYYVPSAQYRLSDMVATIPIQSFDLQFYWQDATDNVYPIEITIYQQINIKLAFLRKNLYKKPNIL